MLCLVAVSLAVGGVRLSRYQRLWLIAFFIAFAPVVGVILLNRVPAMHYTLLPAWLGRGYNEFLVMSVCVPLLFGILIPRLPHKRQKISVSLLTALLTVYYVTVPFLEPALTAKELAMLETVMEEDVCMQTTGYTCGAASAVTALRALGIETEESEMAIASRTTRRWGTTEQLLAEAIEGRYAKEGMHCECRGFGSVEEMREWCPVIAVVKHSFMVDHFVTVLEVDEETVTVGDPIKGRVTYSHEEFETQWRTLGVAVQRSADL